MPHANGDHRHLMPFEFPDEFFLPIMYEDRVRIQGQDVQSCPRRTDMIEVAGRMRRPHPLRCRNLASAERKSLGRMWAPHIATMRVEIGRVTWLRCTTWASERLKAAAQRLAQISPSSGRIQHQHHAQPQGLAAGAVPLDVDVEPFRICRDQRSRERHPWRARELHCRCHSSNPARPYHGAEIFETVFDVVKAASLYAIPFEVAPFPVATQALFGFQ